MPLVLAMRARHTFFYITKYLISQVSVALVPGPRLQHALLSIVLGAGGRAGGPHLPQLLSREIEGMKGSCCSHHVTALLVLPSPLGVGPGWMSDCRGHC